MQADCVLASTDQGQAADRAAADLLAPHNTDFNKRLHRSCPTEDEVHACFLTLEKRAEQSRAEQSRAEQSRAEQSRAEQDRKGKDRTVVLLHSMEYLKQSSPQCLRRVDSKLLRALDRGQDEVPKFRLQQLDISFWL